MSLKQNNLVGLFPELKEWNSGRGIRPIDWVSAFGSMPDALLYSSIFWPNFMEFEGCLIFSSADLSIFQQWKESLNDNKMAIEKMMNHCHLTDFFPNSQKEPTNEQIVYFGNLLKEMWLCKLKQDFPHLPVRVEFYWQNSEATEDAQITVYLER